MTGEEFYEFGPFRLEPAERRLSRGGRPVALTPKCFDLLVVLVENSGHLLIKDELLQLVWPDQFVEESSLSFNISELRKLLGDEPSGVGYIETVRKKGFRFVAPVKKRHRIEPGSIDGDVPSPSQDAVDETATSTDAAEAVVEVTSTVSSSISGRPSLSWTLIVVALALFASFFWMKDAIVSPGQPIQTIAVLPFKPLSSHATDESFEMGMAETLITRLGSARAVMVRPISAVRRYTDLEQDAAAAGRELGVEAVLEGHIQRSGGRIRVTARLVRAADGGQLWAGKFDEDFTEIFAVQDSISEQVARSLPLPLSGEQERQLTKRDTQSPQAYELYVKGRFFLNKRTGYELEKALEHFRQALVVDSHYALAYSGLADAYSLLSALRPVPPRESFPLAKQAAERALSLDNTLTEAHTSLAFVSEAFDWDFAGAERGYRRAIDIDENYSTARQRYGMFLSVMGRFDEGLAELERARQLDPTSLIINSDIGLANYFARRYDRCIEHLQKAIEMHPHSFRPHLNVVGCYVQKGMFDQAIAAAQKASDLMVTGSQGARPILSYSYAVARREREARAMLGEWAAHARQFTQPFAPAAAYAALGDKDTALELLKIGYEQRAYMPRLAVDPALDSLRSEPRFQELVARIRRLE